MDLSPLEYGVSLVLSGGGSSVLTAFFGWLRERSRGGRLAKDQVERAARDLVRTAMSAANTTIERLEGEVEDLRKEMRTQKAECEARDRQNAEEIDRLKDEIAKHMKGEVPNYKPRDLRRVGKP